nr:unnamed protein product [Callosobruchus analis]
METVEAIVKNTEKEAAFKNGKPGQKWYSNFLKRHPRIALREAESVTKARAIVTEEAIRAWFRELRQYLKDTNNEDILDDPNRILNADEAGFGLCPKTGKVLAPRGYKNLYSIKLGNEKENLTVLIVFTASGKICPPLVVFPYVRPPKALVNNMPPNWVLGRSDSGYMRGDVFFEYIANDFNEWVTQNDLKRPILLFIDGHKSHMTMNLSEFCDTHGIILYCLPPNTTHILQPADVSVFKPLKTEWKKTVREWQRHEVNKCVTKINFCRVFELALKNTNMKQHIINGFRRCGLFPLNDNNVDYSKCIKNIIEKNAASTHTSEVSPLSPHEIYCAKKVIERIRSKLTDYGINVDVIINEIATLEGDSLVGAILPIEAFDIPQQSSEVFINHPNEILHNTSAQEQFGVLKRVEDVVEDKGENNDEEEVLNEKVIQLEAGSAVKQNIEKGKNEEGPNTSTIEIQEGGSKIQDCGQEPREKLNKDKFEAEASEIDATSQIKIQSDSIQYIPLKASFDNILKFKFPNDLAETFNKNKKTQNLPKAINSQVWRNFHQNKENEKTQKAESIKKRKQERINALKTKKKKTVNKNTPQEEAEATVAQSTEVIYCAACDEELHSDTDDEDDKNIGCDSCTKWFHLRCTELFGMPFEEAAEKDYNCFTCS